MPTTKDIREMTESRRVALGLQSRAYGNNYKSVSQLPKDDVPRSRWEKAMPRNENIDNYKHNMRAVNANGPDASGRNFLTHDDRRSRERGGFDGHHDQQIGYNAKPM